MKGRLDGRSNQFQWSVYRWKVKANKNNEIDLFSGYLKCSHCGKHVVVRKSKNQVYYYCSSYIKDKSCEKYSINKNKLEQIAICIN